VGGFIDALRYHTKIEGPWAPPTPHEIRDWPRGNSNHHDANSKPGVNLRLSQLGDKLTHCFCSSLVLESDVEDPAYADRPQINFIPELVPNEYVAPNDYLTLDGLCMSIGDFFDSLI
jgi:hypothetical protein